MKKEIAPVFNNKIVRGTTMNEDKIRAAFDRLFIIEEWEDPDAIKSHLERFYKFGYQAALATRPDVNQELVEALEGLSRAYKAVCAMHHHEFDGEGTWYKISQDALAKHKTHPKQREG